ncbi:DASH complex subunit dam1 [Naganishia albida]|nr:DASH complex subunit dam1 [Naganishia albida]
MPSKPHPLRRISTNSLTALARSQQSSSESPSHLQFLAPALQDLVDESASLVQNTRALNKVSEALGVFNEGFGAYLYALRMGAFCVDWREGPEGGNFDLPPLEPAPPQPEPTIDEQSATIAPQDMTYCTAPDTTATEADVTIQATTSARGRGIPRGRGTSARGRTVVSARVAVAPGGKKPPANAVEKRKREAAVNAIVDTLPIEYRGSDPIARQMMERVLGHLMDNPQGQRMAEIVKPLGLPQAKVNKCLIALVGKKAVTKTAVGGVAVYALV